MQNIIITECPRDAMQGLKEIIPTEVKTSYLNSLLKVGFDVIDFGSFVSPKAVPQLADTAMVLKNLDLSDTGSKLLSIVANRRGADEAVNYGEISYLGFPFSVSETFQKRNVNSTIAESFHTVTEIQNLCAKTNKKLIVYLSMGFGNPYGDPWNEDIVAGWANQIINSGVEIISVADTVGVAKANEVGELFGMLTASFPSVAFGVHLHCRYDNWQDKVKAAYNNGCRRFDVAMRGFGGCPFANDELVGNLASENLLKFIHENNIENRIDGDKFALAMKAAEKVFH